MDKRLKMSSELLERVKVTIGRNEVKVLAWIQHRKQELGLRMREDDAGQFIKCHKWC